MLVFLMLLCGALFMLMMHRIVRNGLPARSFSASEAFVLGHWPFLYLNAVIVALTGGQAWGSVDELGAGAIYTAAFVITIGLLAFGLGSWLGGRRRHAPESPIGRAVQPPVRVAAARMLLASATLVLVGGAASWMNRSISIESGRDDRILGLLAVAHLLTPAALFAFMIAVRQRQSRPVRLIALAICGVALLAMSWQWSRRPLVVAVAAMIVILPLLKRHVIPRRTILLAVPLLAVLAGGLMLFRIVVFYGAQVGTVAQNGVVAWYLSRLWIESSAFSALAFLVKHVGVFSFRGPESLLAPLFFWVPRSAVLWKPRGFELGQLLSIDYTLPVSVYGEVMISFSILLVMPFFFVMGYVVKRIDLYALWDAKTDLAKAIYTVFVFDMIFVVRGSFNAMVQPLLIHAIIPIGLIALFATLRQRSLVPRRVGPSTQLAPDRNPEF